MNPDYRQRRQTLRAKQQRGVIILHKGGEHFNENLYYLTGLETFFTTAIIDLQSDFECILTNEIELPHISQSSGISDLRPSNPENLHADVVNILKSLNPQSIFIDYSLYSKTPLPPFLYDAIRSEFSEASISHLPDQLLHMRLVKDKYEIEVMKKGVGILTKIFETLKGLIAPGVTETSLAAEIYRQLVLGGFNKFYDISVASGPRSSIPYYRSNDNVLPDKGVVLIDIAAAIDNYVCDMTRTFPISGQFNEKEQALYDLVIEAQAEAIAGAVPGANLDDLNMKAYDIFKKHNLERYYYNKIGHFLGLGVDDQGGSDVTLEEGMVITIEPGLYMHQDGLGIRKEDMVFCS
jgi:Xaa-Pro aminopeptidase